MVHLFTLLLIIFNIYNSILLKILNIINSIINNISKECKEFFISWVIIARHLKGAWQVALLPFRPNDLSIVSTCLAPWRCRAMTLFNQNHLFFHRRPIRKLHSIDIETRGKKIKRKLLAIVPPLANIHLFRKYFCTAHV